MDNITDVRPLLSFPPQNDTIDASLTITDLTIGCTDTYRRRILLTELLEVQNFFSPNDDNIFDEFVIDGGNIPLHIMIFSRTGTLVYEAKGSKVIRWNGTTASGHKLKSGVYFYLLKALKGDPGERFTREGFVHLFR
jgi:gliding motility-associated-like protein